MNKEIECERCGKIIEQKNPQHKYCSRCSSQINREKTKERNLKRHN